MPSVGRALYRLTLIVSLAVLSLPVVAQQVIATVPVDFNPIIAAVNPATNKIYVTNACGSDPNCAGDGTLSVMDGSTLATTSITVGSLPYGVAVNSVTNRIYVGNECGNDVTCNSWSGTVTVLDGASNNVIATIPVGSDPYALAVNPVTNKIYVANYCGNDSSCQSFSGTVTVIDGASNNIITTVTVGSAPVLPVVNSTTNKIYVANGCGSDPTCFNGSGTVTVIDGATNNPTFVNAGVYPSAVDVNSVTNKIYVANNCGDDPNCGSTATVTVIDGASLGTTDVPIGGYFPYAIAVNSVTNKIYVPSQCAGDPSCQGAPLVTVSVIDGGTLGYTSVAVGEVEADTVVLNSVTNKIYVANQCGSDPTCVSPNGTVTVIDGGTLATTNIFVGNDPFGLALNSLTNRVYVANNLDATVSVIDGTPPTALQFVAVIPCRLYDTRPPNGSGPIQGGTFQNFSIAGAPQCGIPASAAAYSLNVTVVPQAILGYLTIWPAGGSRPVVSTLNSLDGRIKADAAIVPAGDNGAISVFATDTTNVILDIDGYFAPVSGSTLAFYPLPPCRVADTRDPNKPSGLGMPHLSGLVARDFPVLLSPCIPSGVNPQAYSLNFTAVPYPPGSGNPLGYLEVWPKDQQPQNPVSTLNNLTGTVVANAAIVPAGTGGQITAFANNDTDLVIDVNGYFAAAGTGGLSLYGVTPCRVIDTRNVGSGDPFVGTLTPPVDVVDTGCGTSSLAQAYVFNATVVPPGAMGYLTLWPDGADQPVVSTLNAIDGWITNNMAIVPSTNGQVDAFASGLTQLILDISSYFAP